MVVIEGRKLQKETNYYKANYIFQTYLCFLQIITSYTGKMCGHEKKCVMLTVPSEYIYYAQSAFTHQEIFCTKSKEQLSLQNKLFSL